ncbi:MAG: hypothetical protein IKP84_05855 [Prevotella sp.]|nr:hypothetical protein [Prevotella sp.]
MKRDLFYILCIFIALATVSCGGDDDSAGNGYSNNNGRGITLHDGDSIPSQVLANPSRYGFSWDAVLIVHRYNYDSGSYTFTYEDEAWTDGEGCFIVGSDNWNNTYLQFHTEKRDISTQEGVIVMDGEECYATYSDDERFVFIIPNLDIEIQKVKFDENNSFTESYQGPTYNEYLGALYTSSTYFNVYTDNFSLDDVQATTSSSWLTVSKIMLNHKKGEIGSNGSTYDYNLVSIWWYNSENTTGSDRVGYIYITLKADGETYNHTLQVTQKANSSGGSSGGSGGSGDNSGGSSGGSGGSGDNSGGSSYSNMTKAQFQASYNKYAELAKSIWNNYSNMKGSATNSILSSMRSQYREVQSDMRELRSEASKNGYTLTKSEWETKSLP